MKKKIITGVLVVMIILMSLITLTPNAFAANHSNSYYNSYIPDRFELTYENETEDHIYQAYYGDDYYSSITSSAWKYTTNRKPYSQTDLDEHIQMIKNVYNETNTSTLTGISGSMIELNGVKGYQVTYTTNIYNTAFGYRIFELRTDHHDYTLELDGLASHLNSSEFNQVINSFIMKDTTTKSRGIPFTDVASNAWYYNAAKYAYTNNIISGYNAYTFGPEDNLTRGQLVTILWRMEGSPKVSGTPKFPDVQDSSQYYFKAVKWATDNNIVSGYNNGKFGPEDNITREQLAVMLNKFAKYNKKNVSVSKDLSSFKDARKVSDYAISQMKWAVGAGVITGNADGTLNPLGTATRAEVAAMLEKYCKKVGR